jgi:hypothetical protein
MRLKIVVAILGCVLALATYPASAGALVKAFWGPDTLTNGQSAFPVYQDLGVNVFQQTLSWHDVATSRPANPTDPNDPAYSWPDQIDRDIQEAQTHGMQVLLMPMFTPPWANGGQPENQTPDDPNDYANFVIAAAKRYPQVKLWMIWGEPCSARNYEPITSQPIGKPLTAEQKLQPQSYAVLLDDAYGALKSVSQDNVVIGGNSWSVCDIRPFEWVRYLKLPGGRRPRMDLYGHNPFTFFSKAATPPRYHIADFPALPRLQAYINRYLQQPGGKPIRLWLSEFTLPTGPDTEFNFHYSEARQASLIRSTFAMAHRVHAASYGWIFLQDTPASNPPDNRHRGGLLRADGSKKPGYNVYKRAH